MFFNISPKSRRDQGKFRPAEIAMCLPTQLWWEKEASVWCETFKREIVRPKWRGFVSSQKRPIRARWGRSSSTTRDTTVTDATSKADRHPTECVKRKFYRHHVMLICTHLLQFCCLPWSCAWHPRPRHMSSTSRHHHRRWA